jgi:hypothetical protein
VISTNVYAGPRAVWPTVYTVHKKFSNLPGASLFRASSPEACTPISRANREPAVQSKTFQNGRSTRRWLSQPRPFGERWRGLSGIRHSEGTPLTPYFSIFYKRCHQPLTLCSALKQYGVMFQGGAERCQSGENAAECVGIEPALRLILKGGLSQVCVATGECIWYTSHELQCKQNFAHRTPVASTHGPQPPRPDRTHKIPFRSLSDPFPKI